MLILSVHNYYQQPGGEDEVVAAESALLRSRGHEVIEHTEHNDRVESMSRFRVALRSVWSREAYRRTRSLSRKHRPDVMHVHNSFPLLSPAIYYAARAEGVPVVQSLHNFRLLCSNALLFRDGHVCEDCLGRRVPGPGVVHACYRGSRSGSAAVAGMIAAHRGLRTWERQVDVYLALTEFGRRKFIQGGLPAERIMVKPHFVASDPGTGNGGPRGHALFVGRLSAEKGLRTLLRAWAVHGIELPLHLIGDGPLYPEVKRFVTEGGLEGRVRLLGRVPPGEVFGHLHSARFLVVPSESYETFGRVIIEAFACGIPVIASDLGASAEIVEDGLSGVHFRVGSEEELAGAVSALAADPERCRELGRGARAAYEEKYSAMANYPLLMQAYEAAIARSRSRDVPSDAPGDGAVPPRTRVSPPRRRRRVIHG